MTEEVDQRDERLFQKALQLNHIRNDLSSSTSPFHCNVCQVFFTGRAPLLQHLVSAKHDKKVLQRGAVATVLSISSPQANDKGNETEAVKKAFELGHVRSISGAYICDICQAPLSGEAPLRQHVNSPNHAKKLRNRGGAFDMSGIKNALSNIGINEEVSSIVKKATEDGHVSEDKLSAGAYFCNVCCVPLTGVKPLEQHLQGNNHLVRTRRNDHFQILHDKENSPPNSSSISFGSSTSPSLFKTQTTGQNSQLLPEEIADILIIQAHEPLDSLFN